MEAAQTRLSEARAAVEVGGVELLGGELEELVEAVAALAVGGGGHLAGEAADLDGGGGGDAEAVGEGELGDALDESVGVHALAGHLAEEDGVVVALTDGGVVEVDALVHVGGAAGQGAASGETVEDEGDHDDHQQEAEDQTVVLAGGVLEPGNHSGNLPEPFGGCQPVQVPPALAFTGVVHNPWRVPKPLQCIVAVARNGVIGREGKLPWHIPEDLAWFMDQTKGGVMIEGPACYAELGKALPDRGTVVVSRDPTKSFPGAERAASLAEAIVIADRMDQWPGPVWITGGERIYAEGTPLCERLFITRIDRDFEGDRRFPSDWQRYFTKLVSSKKGEHEGLGYAFEVWER